MVNKPVNRSKLLTVLEIAFVGLLAWVVLSGVLFSPDSTVQASRAGGKTLGKKMQGRKVPREGVPAKSSKILAAIGTPNACQGFDFAGGAIQGFTVQNVDGATLWHVTNGLCRASLSGHSTPFDFYYGQDATCNYNTGARNASNLTSPPISLAGVFPPYNLGFNYLLFVESSFAFDTTFVDLSTNGGATWAPVLSKANLINDNQWHNAAVDATAAIGAATTVQLRFRFDSVDNLVNSSTGWHVDDVLVCGQPFNFCVQDDTRGDYIQFNSVTGVYVTKQCSTGFTAGGVGTVTTSGPLVTLQQNSGGLFNSVTVNTSTHTGNATIRVVNGLSIVAYNIHDSNTLNNSCSCP